MVTVEPFRRGQYLCGDCHEKWDLGNGELCACGKFRYNVPREELRRCLMHGSETWPMKVEHELKMNHTEMNMIRWMCGVKLNERQKSEELLGLEPVSLMIKRVG